MSCLYFAMFLIPVLGVPFSSNDQNANYKIVENPEQNAILPTLFKAEVSDEVGSTDDDFHENFSEETKVMLWKETKVLYSFSDNPTEIVSDGTKKIVEAAMKHLQDFSCLTFKPISEEEKGETHLLFIRQRNSILGECWSFAKTHNSPIKQHFIGVSDACDQGNITHLIMRALGIIDEHRRPDRDEYIKLLPEKAVNEAEFRKMISKQDNNMFFKFPYDYSSITHLYPTEFAKPGESVLTIESKKENGRNVFQEKENRTLSILDVVKINAAFHCFNRTAEKFLPKHMYVALNKGFK